MNPYTWLSELYTTAKMKQYMLASFGDNEPHVYAVADAAYAAMIGTPTPSPRNLVRAGLLLPMRSCARTCASQYEYEYEYSPRSSRGRRMAPPPSRRLSFSR